MVTRTTYRTTYPLGQITLRVYVHREYWPHGITVWLCATGLGHVMLACIYVCEWVTIRGLVWVGAGGIVLARY